MNLPKSFINHEKLCTWIKIPRCLDCACNDHMARNTYVYNTHISTHPTTNTAEVPLALLKDTVS